MKKLVLFALVLLLAFYFYNQSGDNDPAYFESYISGMAKAGENKDFESFIGFFSSHYRDEYGINYIYLKNIVKSRFEKYERFEASYYDLKVSDPYRDDQENTLIDINMDVHVKGSREGIPVDIIGETGSADNLTLTLRKTFLGEWKITSVKGVEDKGFDH